MELEPRKPVLALVLEHSTTLGFSILRDFWEEQGDRLQTEPSSPPLRPVQTHNYCRTLMKL